MWVLIKGFKSTNGCGLSQWGGGVTISNPPGSGPELSYKHSSIRTAVVRDGEGVVPIVLCCGRLWS